MSIKAMTAVFEHSAATLGARLVLLSIADNARDDDWQAWPSVESIASKARLSERMAHYAIKKLQEMGELSVAVNTGPRGTNAYTLILPGRPDGGAKSAGVQILHRGAKSSTKGVQSTTKTMTEIAPEPLLKPSKNHQPISDAPKSAAKERQPNPTWDALAEGIGASPRTPTERAIFGKACKELDAANVAPDEIRAACEAHRKHWPKTSVTPLSIVKNLSTLLALAASVSRAPARDDDYYDDGGGRYSSRARMDYYPGSGRPWNG